MKTQIAVFTGYKESSVRAALETIMENSGSFDVDVNGDPVKNPGLVPDQPGLRGCDPNDLHVYSIRIRGLHTDAKSLIRTKTPDGVQIDLLPA